MTGLSNMGQFNQLSTSNFQADSIFGIAGSEDSKLVIAGSDAEGNPALYRLSVTGGIMSVVAAI